MARRSRCWTAEGAGRPCVARSLSCPPYERTRGEGRAAHPADRDVRLGAEIAAIHALARRLARDLESRDPLSERVHLGKAGFALVGGLGAARFLGSR